MRKREPVIRSETPDDALGDYREKHPAFGQVSIHRVNHGPTKFALYGAASEHHMTTVRLVVSKSERAHNLSRDWYFSKGDLVEIEMTSLQFADLLTSFNMGSGVPCTTRYAGGETTPDIPVDDTTEIGRIKDGFKKKMEDFCSEKGIEAARYGGGLLDVVGLVLLAKVAAVPFLRRQLHRRLRRLLPQLDGDGLLERLLHGVLVTRRLHRLVDQVPHSLARIVLVIFICGKLPQNHCAGLLVLETKLMNCILRS